MRLGIGTGSHRRGVRAAARREGRQPASTSSACRRRSAPPRSAASSACGCRTLDETPELDLTIDGADEVDPDAHPDQGRRRRAAAREDRRGRVGAHDRHRRRTRSSSARSAASRCRSRSTVSACGHRTRHRARRPQLGLSGRSTLRMTSGQPFVTDGGHLILDASFGRIPDTRALSNALHAIPGVVEHGLFLGLASTAVIAGADGISIRPGDPTNQGVLPTMMLHQPRPSAFARSGSVGRLAAVARRPSRRT